MHHLFRIFALFVSIAGSANAQSNVPICTPAVSDDRVVSSASARQTAAASMQTKEDKNRLDFAWPDTPIGVIQTSKGYIFFASDGSKHIDLSGGETNGSVVRSVGTMEAPLGDKPPLEVTISPNPDPTVNPQFNEYTYLGGGPVYRVPTTMPGGGKLLMVTHAEIITPETKPRPSFYSVLGLAVSDDNGLSWVALGEIIRINHPYNKEADGFEIGDPPLSLTLDGKFFQIYFRDWQGNEIHRGVGETTLAVARASVTEVLQAAFGMHPHAAAFRKYFNGLWEEPGLGGRSADIGQHLNLFGDERQVMQSQLLKGYIMILVAGSRIGYSESLDGLKWSEPIILKDFSDQDHPTYITPIGAGSDPMMIGRKFYVFYTWYPTTGEGWQGADLRRFTVDCN